MKPGNGLAYRHAFSPQKPAVNEPLAEYTAELCHLTAPCK